jgi:hypothetical protein
VTLTQLPLTQLPLRNRPLSCSLGRPAVPQQLGTHSACILSTSFFSKHGMLDAIVAVLQHTAKLW